MKGEGIYRRLEHIAVRSTVCWEVALNTDVRFRFGLTTEEESEMEMLPKLEQYIIGAKRHAPVTSILSIP